MADAEKGSPRIGSDGVEEVEERPLPGIALQNALAELGGTVIQARIEVAGTTCADVELETGLRHRQRTADIEGQHADFLTGVRQDVPHLFGVVEDCVRDRVVPDVRPRMVHVEQRYVDPVRRGRRGVVSVDADVFEELVWDVKISLRHRLVITQRRCRARSPK